MNGGPRCKSFTNKRASKMRTAQCPNPGKWECEEHGAFCGVHTQPQHYAVGKARRLCPICRIDITDQRAT